MIVQIINFSLRKKHILAFLLFVNSLYGQKNILFLGASHHEKKIFERPSIKKAYTFFYYNDLTKDISHILQGIKKRYKKKKFNGILSTQDYLGNISAALLAEELGLPGPSLQAVLTCQHKYYSRLAQQRLIPHATPCFGLIDPENICTSINQLPFSFPFFAKPVKSYFSFGAMKIHSLEELQENIFNLLPASTFVYPLNNILKRYHFPLSAHYLLAEDILKGKQCTLEGFVANRTVHIIGIVDSIMYPGTISFEHFEYPSLLPEKVQARMADIAQTFVTGIGFNNSFFNIEMMYNPAADKIYIIEVNPRAASQFADLYEKVDGMSSYESMLALATNSSLPIIPKRKGPYALAASFALRVFYDGKVIKVPTPSDLKKVQHLFPDARIQIHVTRGKKLSDALQDGKSYLYAIINIGGNNKKDLFSRLERCKAMLPFSFSSERGAYSKNLLEKGS